MYQQAAVFNDDEERREQERLKRVRWTWTEWLSSVEWSHWVTLTFGRKTGMFRAQWDFERRWIRRLEQTAQNRVDWFAVYERDDYTRLHIHALIRGTDRLEPGELRRAWGGLGHATAPKFDTTRNGIAYTVKRLGEPGVFYDARDNFDGDVPLGEPFGRRGLKTDHLDDDLVAWE